MAGVYEKRKLSPIQIKFLIYLLYQSEERRTVSSLARHFNLTKPTVSDAVKTLEKKGFVGRKTEKEDKRVSTLHLTKKGAATAKSLSGFASQIVQSLYEMDKERQSILLESLFDVIERLHSAGLMHVARICFTCSNLERKTQPKTNYHCKRKNKTMKPHELRIDCQFYLELVPVNQR